MRYLVYKTPTGKSDNVIIFPEEVSFKDMAYLIDMEDKRIISAGEVSLTPSGKIQTQRHNNGYKKNWRDDDQKLIERKFTV